MSAAIFQLEVLARVFRFSLRLVGAGFKRDGNNDIFLTNRNEKVKFLYTTGGYGIYVHLPVYLKGGSMKRIKLLSIIAGMILATGISVSAQMEMGKMGGHIPEEIARMMQEQNKALAQASIQYMTVFANSLHVQLKERRDRIDNDFINSAFAEMKRACQMIDRFQSAHVKTMDDKMQARVKPMMERMDRNLAFVKKNLDELGKEVNGRRDLDKMTFFAGEILKHLDDLPKGPGAMQGSQGEKQPMMK